jgi:hypothetical protein
MKARTWQLLAEFALALIVAVIVVGGVFVIGYRSGYLDAHVVCEHHER